MTEKFEVEISSNLLASLALWEKRPEHNIVEKAMLDFVGKYGYGKGDLNQKVGEVLLVRKCKK